MSSNELIEASKSGDAALVDKILHKGDEGSSPVNVEVTGRDRAKRRSLHVAAVEGHTEVVALLVEADAKIDVRDRMGRSPLALAADEGHVAVVRQLIEAGAAADGGYSKRKCEPPLCLAVAQGHSEVMEVLLEHLPKSALENFDFQGNTALLMACKHGRSELLQRLLKAGADGDAINHDDRNALDLAVEWRDQQGAAGAASDIVQVLERWQESQLAFSAAAVTASVTAAGVPKRRASGTPAMIPTRVPKGE